ncbi:hypothetical protein ACFX2C_017377 [Malus domestica]
MMERQLQQSSQSIIDVGTVATNQRKLVREFISNKVTEGNKVVEDKSMGGGGENTRAGATCTSRSMKGGGVITWSTSWERISSFAAEVYKQDALNTKQAQHNLTAVTNTNQLESGAKSLRLKPAACAA